MFRRGLRPRSYRPTVWERMRLVEEAADSRAATEIEFERNLLELKLPSIRWVR